MIKIERNKELIMNNVLSIRKKMTQEQIQEEIRKIGELIQSKVIKPTGNLVSTNFSVDSDDGKQILDTEILLPIEKVIELPSEYKIKKKFILKNAVFTEYKGNPLEFEEAITDMLLYVTDHKLQQITSLYSEQVSVDSSNGDITLNCYIGVSENIL